MSGRHKSRRKERVKCYDTMAQIAMCERCQKPECDDCIGSHLQSGRNQDKWEQFRALYGQGLTDSEIAAAMGIATPTVCYRRKRLGLEPNRRPTPQPDPCAGCYTRKIGVCINGTCDRRRRWEKITKEGEQNERELN